MSDTVVHTVKPMARQCGHWLPATSVIECDEKIVGATPDALWGEEANGHEEGWRQQHQAIQGRDADHIRGVVCLSPPIREVTIRAS